MLRTGRQGKSRSDFLSLKGKKPENFPFRARENIEIFPPSFWREKVGKNRVFPREGKSIYYVYRFFPFPPVRGEVVVRQLTHDDSFPCPDKAIFFSERRM